MLRLVAFYLILKSVAVLTALSAFQSFFGSDPFYYRDFLTYTEFSASTPNALFAFLIESLRLETINSPLAKTLAFAINSGKDIGFIWITYKYVNQRAASVLCVLIAVHPFLALYHMRLVTTVFISVVVLLVCLMEFMPKSRRFTQLCSAILAIVLVGFRYTGGVVLAIYFLARFRKNLVVLIILLGAAATASYVMSDYFLAFVNGSLDPKMLLSLPSLREKLSPTGISFVDLTLVGIVYIISHMVFLTGFREAAYLRTLEHFTPITASSFAELVLFFGLSVFHLIGFALFTRKFYKTKLTLVLTFVAAFFASVFLISHLRYFVHLIPISLIGFSVTFASNQNSPTRN